MPDHSHAIVSGTITHIFGHRFVVRTNDGDVLADLTPKGLEQIALHHNDNVTLEGEMKPWELKVERFTRAGQTILIEHKKKAHGQHHPDADPAIVTASARAAGFQVLGSPRRKPKHFELLGQQRGEFSELHIELNGHIRKSRLVTKGDPKWSAELREGL